MPGVVLATERVGGDDAIEFHKDRLKARGLGKETSPGAMATENTDSEAGLEAGNRLRFLRGSCSQSAAECSRRGA